MSRSFYKTSCPSSDLLQIFSKAAVAQPEHTHMPEPVFQISIPFITTASCCVGPRSISVTQLNLMVTIQIPDRTNICLTQTIQIQDKLSIFRSFPSSLPLQFGSRSIFVVLSNHSNTRQNKYLSRIQESTIQIPTNLVILVGVSRQGIHTC